MDKSVEQLESALAQDIKSLHQNSLNYEVGHVTCHFLSPHELVIIIDDSITKTERILWQSGYQELAKQVRRSLTEIIRTDLREIAERAAQSTIVDLLSDVNMRTERSSLVFVFERGGELTGNRLGSNGNKTERTRFEQSFEESNGKTVQNPIL